MDEYCENEINEFLRKLKNFKDGVLFLQPIEEIIEAIPIYKEIIEKPIDLLKIIQKFKDGKYNTLLEIKYDIDLMVKNCFSFNQRSPIIMEKCKSFNNFYQNNWEKLYNKIEKRNEKKKSYLNQKRLQSKEEHFSSMHAPSKQVVSEKNDNVAILLYEDTQIEKRIKNLFESFKGELELNEEAQGTLVNNIINNISKRKKTFEEIYEYFNSYIKKHLKEEAKSRFSKKFQKLLRTLEDEQNEETIKMDSKALNIKIDLNENEEKREEKRKIDIIKKELRNFVENQKVPDVYLDPDQYSIDPILKKKIYSHVLGIREKMCMSYNQDDDLADL